MNVIGIEQSLFSIENLLARQGCSGCTQQLASKSHKRQTTTEFAELLNDLMV
jgi:hypothetical protein